MTYRLNNLFIFLITCIVFNSTSLNASIYSATNGYITNDKISSYLKGSIMLNSDKFSEANKHFSKVQSLSAVHKDYNSQYIFSLVVDGKIDSANKLIARLDPSQKETFLFQFIEGVHLINSRNYFLAKKKFKSIKTNKADTAIIIPIIFCKFSAS